MTNHKLPILLVLILFYFANNELKAQNDNHQRRIDTAMAFSPFYTPVRYATNKPHQFSCYNFYQVDTAIDFVENYLPFMKTSNIYQTLGFPYQAQKNMLFDFDYDGSINLITLPYQLFFKQQKDLEFIDVKTSFTKLVYSYELFGHNFFDAVHAQRYKGLTAIANINGFTSNKGSERDFINQQTSFFSISGIIKYVIPSTIYGFKISYILNRINAGENGGLSDLKDTTLNFLDYNYFLSHNTFQTSPNNYFVNNENAFSNIMSHDLLLQQYIKIMFKIKDKYISLGNIIHTFQYKQQNIKYFNPFFFDSLGNTTFFPTDTMIELHNTRNVINSIQWANYTPFDTFPNKPYFICLAGGILHEYGDITRTKFHTNSFSLFGRTDIRLFAIFDFHGEFLYSFWGYLHNNAIIKGNAIWIIRKQNILKLKISAEYYRIEPDYFFSNYNGYNYKWENTFKKQNILKLNATLQFHNMFAGINYFLLNRFVTLDEHIKPYVDDKFNNIVQLQLYTPFRIKSFGFNANMYLQYSSSEHIPLPLFAIKTDFYYIFKVIKNRLQIQPGVNVMLNTTYNAYSYIPELHQFTYQNSINNGNYPYIGIYLNLRIQKISIFGRLDNVLATFIGNNYFTTPYYPMQKFNFSFGVNWRFYD